MVKSQYVKDREERRSKSCTEKVAADMTPASEELESSFSNYAVVNGFFVPIILRHCKNSFLRDLQYAGIEKISLNGEVEQSMCSFCSDAIPCMIRNSKNKYTEHKCSVTKEKIGL